MNNLAGFLQLWQDQVQDPLPFHTDESPPSTSLRKYPAAGITGISRCHIWAYPAKLPALGVTLSCCPHLPHLPFPLSTSPSLPPPSPPPSSSFTVLSPPPFPGAPFWFVSTAQQTQTRFTFMHFLKRTFKIYWLDLDLSIAVPKSEYQMLTTTLFSAKILFPILLKLVIFAFLL